MLAASSSLAMRRISSPASLPTSTARCRPLAPPPRAQQKGFGTGGSDPQQQRSGSGGQKKVSKRGKVASRPSPQLQLQSLQEQDAAFRAALAAKEASQQQGEQQEGQQLAAAAQQRPAVRATAPADSASSSSAAAIPEVVSNRMLQRIVVCAGAPVFLGLTLFPLFYWIKVKEGIDLPTWVVYVVQTLTWGGGLAGITYGALSASWDPRREGSLLGWTEFRANLPLLLDRFRRD